MNFIFLYPKILGVDYVDNSKVGKTLKCVNPNTFCKPKYSPLRELILANTTYLVVLDLVY